MRVREGLLERYLRVVYQNDTCVWFVRTILAFGVLERYSHTRYEQRQRARAREREEFTDNQQVTERVSLV